MQDITVSKLSMFPTQNLAHLMVLGAFAQRGISAPKGHPITVLILVQSVLLSMQLTRHLWLTVLTAHLGTIVEVKG